MGGVSLDLAKGVIASTSEKLCLITFDDGHISNLEAAKILRGKGLKAVFYVVKDYCQNKPDYLTEEMVKEISDMGHTIGIHGKDHKHWTSKSDTVLISELREVKDWIEGITGKECITCSAPGGFVNNRVLRSIEKNFPRFKVIRTSEIHTNTLGEKINGCVCIHSDTTISEFQKIIAGDSFYYFYHMVFWKLKNFVKKIIRK